jgi:transmembrane sensor
VTRLTQKQRRLAAANQAAHWLVALQTVELPRQQKSEFIDWLRESPLHVSEMLHACRLQRDLGAFDRWNNINVSEGPTENKVLALVRQSRLSDTPAPGRRRRIASAFAIAACLAGALVVSSYLFNRFSESRWTTELGERREVTLSDGSVVDLAPSSEVRARFENNLRMISLKRGEALFHVAKDPNRPFIVQVANTRVRAVGTVFNVAQSDQGVSVTVVEGRVTVSEKGAPNGAGRSEQSTPLGADEQMVISAVDHSSKVRKVKGELEVAWAAGQLVFENEPVAEIVRRFNLYNKVQLQLADAHLGERRMGGMFRATDPESFVEFLQSAGGVAVNRSSSGVVVIGTTVDNAAVTAAP